MGGMADSSMDGGANARSRGSRAKVTGGKFLLLFFCREDGRKAGRGSVLCLFSSRSEECLQSSMLNREKFRLNFFRLPYSGRVRLVEQHGEHAQIHVHASAAQPRACPTSASKVCRRVFRVVVTGGKKQQQGNQLPSGRPPRPKYGDVGGVETVLGSPAGPKMSPHRGSQMGLSGDSASSSSAAKAKRSSLNASGVAAGRVRSASLQQGLSGIVGGGNNGGGNHQSLMSAAAGLADMNNNGNSTLTCSRSVCSCLHFIM